MSGTNEPPPWATSPTPTTFERTVNPASNVRAGDAIHTLQGYVQRETEKAVLFEVWQVAGMEIDLELKARTMWFPLSQVKSITHAAPANGDSALEYDNIQIKEWILGQKGLI